LDPLKIQGRFNFEFIPEFITCNSDGFGSGAKRKVVQCYVLDPLKTFQKFRRWGSSCFVFFKMEHWKNQLKI
jgi:hypothetical protein